MEPEDTIFNSWDQEDDDDDSEEDELPPIVAVNMNTLSRFGPSDLMVEKETFLEPQRLHAVSLRDYFHSGSFLSFVHFHHSSVDHFPQVRTLTHLHCREDPAWTLQLLERAAPRLHELHLVTPSWAHLQVLGTMHQLNKLEVQYYGEDWNRPMLFSPAPAAHRGLEWLRVSHLPKETTLSLLRAHRRSLRALQLTVGTAGDEAWPAHCSYLPALLGECGLQALRSLLLVRSGCHHRPADCRAQRTALRAALPAATAVTCDSCPPQLSRDPDPTGPGSGSGHATGHATGCQLAAR